MYKRQLYEEDMKEKIIDSAVSHYRVPSRKQAQESIEEMLYSMYNDLNIVETLTAQLVESDTNYRRLAKQKIMYLCNSDQGLKGKLVDLILHMKDDPDNMCEIVNDNLHIQQIHYIEKDEVYTFDQRKRKTEKEVMTFDFEDMQKDQKALEERIGFDRISQFSKESISAYYRDKLHGEKAGKLKDMGVKDMDDYIRSILVYVYGRDRKMDITASVLPNETEGIDEGSFHYPNLLIKRKD